MTAKRWTNVYGAAELVISVLELKDHDDAIYTNYYLITTMSY